MKRSIRRCTPTTFHTIRLVRALQQTARLLRSSGHRQPEPLVRFRTHLLRGDEHILGEAFDQEFQSRQSIGYRPLPAHDVNQKGLYFYVCGLTITCTREAHYKHTIGTGEFKNLMYQMCACDVPDVCA